MVCGRESARPRQAQAGKRPVRKEQRNQSPRPRLTPCPVPNHRDPTTTAMDLIRWSAEPGGCRKS